MTKTEQDILAALTELDHQVRLMPQADPKPNLLPLFEKIETLARQLVPGSDSELAHFLHRHSYEKARLLLQGRRDEITRGRCG
jgi:hypothetical protein